MSGDCLAGSTWGSAGFRRSCGGGSVFGGPWVGLASMAANVPGFAVCGRGSRLGPPGVALAGAAAIVPGAMVGGGNDWYPGGGTGGGGRCGGDTASAAGAGGEAVGLMTTRELVEGVEAAGVLLVFDAQLVALAPGMLTTSLLYIGSVV